MKTEYFFIWIEGIEPKGGEKVRGFYTDKYGDMRIDYTLDMMDALRVRKKQIPDMIERLRICGVADWCRNSPNTFVRISYAPKGTVYQSKSYLEKERKKRDR